MKTRRSQAAARSSTLQQMAIRLLTTAHDLACYDAWVRSHPENNLWQSLGWKALQEAKGRAVKIYADTEGDAIHASALVVIDETKGGLSTWEIPRGPLSMTNDELRMTNILDAIAKDAKAEKAISLFISPLTPLRHSSFAIRNSKRHVHPEATRILDLTLDDDALLNQMKPKGRYNIRLAEKHGVTVEQSAHVTAFARLMDETAVRDGFKPSGEKTYAAFLKHVPGSFLLLAYAPLTDGQEKAASAPIAGLIGAIWGTMGIYYYGASSETHRELMAPYLLQWHAMRHCRAQGALSYDLFGIAPEDAKDHPWAGVSDFKAKFGGTVLSYPPEQEIVLRPMAKRLLGLKRKIVG